MRRLALMALPLLAACARVEDPYVVTEARGHLVNPALQIYVDEFAIYYGRPVPALPIYIGPLEKGVAGKCYTPGNKGSADQVADSLMGQSTAEKQRIVISQSYFTRHKADHDKIQIVVFHELGHCILQRGHRDDMMETEEFGEIPVSMMHPKGSFGGEPFYRARHDHYVKELFGGSRRDDAPDEALADMELRHGEGDGCVEFE